MNVITVPLPHPVASAKMSRRAFSLASYSLDMVYALSENFISTRWIILSTLFITRSVLSKCEVKSIDLDKIRLSFVQMWGKEHGFGQNLFILPNSFIEPFKSPPNKTYRVEVLRAYASSSRNENHIGQQYPHDTLFIIYLCGHCITTTIIHHHHHHSSSPSVSFPSISKSGVRLMNSLPKRQRRQSRG